MTPSARDAPLSARDAPPSALEPRPLIEHGSLSYTTLAELERCGYRHYLERVLRLPEVDVRAAAPSARSAGAASRRRPDARALGEVAHRLLERLDFSHPKPPSSTQARSVAAELGIELDEVDAGRLAAQLAALVSTPVGERIAAAREVRTELPFAFSIGDEEPTISGAIDLIAKERDGTCLIVDYKSGAAPDGPELDTVVGERFGAQRLIYALAALRDGAAAVEVVHWFIGRPENPVGARYHARESETLEAELRQRVRTVRERGYAVSERPHRRLCHTCPGRASRLCSWPDERMLGDG